MALSLNSLSTPRPLPQLSTRRAVESSVDSAAPPCQLYTRLAVTSIESIDTKEQWWSGDVQLEICFLVPLELFLVEACWDELAAATPCVVPRAEDVVKLLQHPDANAGTLHTKREELGRAKGVPLDAFRAANARLPSFSNNAWDTFRGDNTEFWAYRIAEKLDIINCKKLLLPQDRHVRGKARLLPGEAGAGWKVCASIVQRIQTTFAQRFFLEDFPFDRQKLLIDVRLQVSKKYMIFAPGNLSDRFYGTVNSVGGADEEEWPSANLVRQTVKLSPVFSCWNLFPRVVSIVKETERDSSWEPTPYSLQRFEIHVSRDPTHYIWHMILPFEMLVFSVFAAVAPIKAENTGERMQVICALFLASIGLRYILRDYLPDTSSHTLLETFSTGCLLFFFATGISVGLVSKYPAGDNPLLRDLPSSDNPRNPSNALMWALLSAVCVLGHLYFFFRVSKALSFGAQEPLSFNAEKAKDAYEAAVWRYGRNKVPAGASQEANNGVGEKDMVMRAEHFKLALKRLDEANEAATLTRPCCFCCAARARFSPRSAFGVPVLKVVSELEDQLEKDVAAFARFKPVDKGLLDKLRRSSVAAKPEIMLQKLKVEYSPGPSTTSSRSNAADRVSFAHFSPTMRTNPLCAVPTAATAAVPDQPFSAATAMDAAVPTPTPPATPWVQQTDGQHVWFYNKQTNESSWSAPP